MADSDSNRLAETTQPTETAGGRTFLAAIGTFLHRRSRAVEEVERIIDEMRELNQLHGEVGQRLMADYEGVLWAMWFNRSANVAIATCIIALGTAFLHSPQWLSFTIAGIGLATSGVLLLISLGHLAEVREYRRGNITVDEDPTPRPLKRANKKAKNGRRTGPDGHSMRRRRRLYP